MRVVHPVLARGVATALLDLVQGQGDVGCHGEGRAQRVPQHAAARGPDDEQVDDSGQEDGQEGTTGDGRGGVLWVGNRGSVYLSYCSVVMGLVTN